MGPATGPPFRRFSIAQLALIVPWVALVIDAWSPIRDNSFLWHVRAGTSQADRAEVLTADPFSFTRAGADWLTQSWLAELFYAWAEGLAGGLSYVPWMLLVVSTLTFIGIGLIAFRVSRSVPATAFVLILSTLLLISFLVPRPVLFSYLLFVLVILAWDRTTLRWTVPFLFWAWASIHGSFIIGLAYVGLTVIMEKDWKRLPSAFAVALPTVLTAHGLGVIRILVEFGEARDALVLLSEWREPEFGSPVFLPFLGGVVFVIIGAYRQLIEPRHLWLLFPFLALGFSSVRAVPPAWLGILPLVALALSGIEIGGKERFGARSASIFALSVVVLPIVLAGDPVIAEDRFPVDARKHLDDVPTFHDDRAGGYLIWAEWPDRLVYIDDRAELYKGLIEEFVGIRDGTRDWEPVFEREGIEQALIWSEDDLIGELVASGWRTVYRDDTYVVLRP